MGDALSRIKAVTCPCYLATMTRNNTYPRLFSLCRLGSFFVEYWPALIAAIFTGQNEVTWNCTSEYLSLQEHVYWTGLCILVLSGVYLHCPAVYLHHPWV